MTAVVLLTAAAYSPCFAGQSETVTGPQRGSVPPRHVIPETSIEKPEDVGRRAHTNYGIVVPSQQIDGPAPDPRDHPR